MVLTTRPSGVNIVQTRSRSTSETVTPTTSTPTSSEITAPIAATGGRPSGANIVETRFKNSSETTTPATSASSETAPPIAAPAELTLATRGTSFLQYTTMAASPRLETFSGDANQDIDQFLRRFDQYCMCLNIKNEQALAQLSWHLDGMARLYIESLPSMPTTVNGLKTVLLEKFQKTRPVNLTIFNMRQEPSESAEQFLSRLEIETFKTKISDEFQVQIALNGLHPTLSSAISTHAPKSLQEVRQLASRLTNIRYAAPVATATPSSLDNTMSVLSAAVAQLTSVLAGKQDHGRNHTDAVACRRCGGRCTSFKNCPARQVICPKCHFKGHFESKCLTTEKTIQARKAQAQWSSASRVQSQQAHGSHPRDFQTQNYPNSNQS